MSAPAPCGPARRAKIAWRCRRGMKELDLLLERFLQCGFDDLSLPEIGAFEHLLESPDQDILAWLSGAAQPDEPALRSLLERVRAALARV